MRISAGLVACFLALPLVRALPAPAQEGEEQRFLWRPSLVVRAVADDNVRQSDRGAEDDFWLSASPRLELGYRARALDVGADVGADFQQYSDNTDLNDVFYRVKTHAEAGLLPGLSVRVSDALTPQPVVLGLPEDDAANRQQTNRAEGEIRYWHGRNERSELTLGVRGARFDSESFPAVVPGPGGSTRIDPHFHADYWEGGSFLELRNAVGDRSAVYLRGRVRYRSFDEAAYSDHTAGSAQLGFQTQWHSRLRLDVAGGWGLVGYRSRSSRSHFLGNALLDYRAGHGWSFEVGAHQRFTTELSGDEFVDTTGRVGVEKSFGRRTVATLTGFLSYLDNESVAPRTNFFGGVELGVQRQLSRNLKLGVAYRYWNNRGAYELDDFAQNRVMLTLGYRYGP